MRTTLLAAVFVTLLPVFAQGETVLPEMSWSEALSGREVPLTLKLSEIAVAPHPWRQFSLSGEEHQSVFGIKPDAIYAAAIAPYLRYYTEGKTLRIGDQTFLVTYRIPLSLADSKRLPLNVDGSDAKPFRIDRNIRLSLALLNLATIGKFHNVTPFEVAQIEAPVPAKMEQAAHVEALGEDSLNNLLFIWMGMEQYLEDKEGILPPMKSATKAQINSPQFGNSESPQTAQESLASYVAPESFIQPTTGVPYQPNPGLSRRRLSSIKNPRSVVVFYEAAPDANGKRGVLFLDGDVKRIKEKDWPALRRASLVTVRLSGAAALYYLFKQRQNANAAGGPAGKLYQSAQGRLYYRLPDQKFQWVSPPTRPIEIKGVGDQPVQVAGSAALYSLYKQHSNPNLGMGENGTWYMAGAERLYALYPDGKLQWVAPPPQPIEVPYETGQYLGLSQYQGYNGSLHGKPFGGYGTGKIYGDAVPAIP